MDHVVHFLTSKESVVTRYEFRPRSIGLKILLLASLAIQDIVLYLFIVRCLCHVCVQPVQHFGGLKLFLNVFYRRSCGRRVGELGIVTCRSPLRVNRTAWCSSVAKQPPNQTKHTAKETPRRCWKLGWDSRLLFQQCFGMSVGPHPIISQTAPQTCPPQLIGKDTQRTFAVNKNSDDQVIKWISLLKFLILVTKTEIKSFSSQVHYRHI